jgi:hypothetical protein
MNTYNNIFDIPTPPTPTNSPAGFFQLYGLPTSDLPDCFSHKRSPSSPTTNRLLNMSGSGLYGRSPICTPFPIATPEAPQISSNNSTSTVVLAKENESLREELRRAKLALQASEERCSEVEEESDYLAECLSEALDLLEHRAAVHKAQVATLEHEVQEKAELKEANERLLKEKQQRMASLTVRLDCCWIVWFGLVGWLGVIVGGFLLGFLLVFCLLFSLFLPFFLKVYSTSAINSIMTTRA